MYTGTLIDDLIATVERAEEHAHNRADSEPREPWYAVAPYELAPAQPNLLGVA